MISKIILLSSIPKHLQIGISLVNINVAISMPRNLFVLKLALSVNE